MIYGWVRKVSCRIMGVYMFQYLYSYGGGNLEEMYLEFPKSTTSVSQFCNIFHSSWRTRSKTIHVQRHHFRQPHCIMCHRHTCCNESPSHLLGIEAAFHFPATSLPQRSGRPSHQNGSNEKDWQYPQETGGDAEQLLPLAYPGWGCNFVYLPILRQHLPKLNLGSPSDDQQF